LTARLPHSHNPEAPTMLQERGLSIMQKIKIKSWEKCPEHGIYFRFINNDFICPVCKRRPRHAYLRWYYHGEEFNTKPSTDISGVIRQGCEIENQINQNRFKPELWKADVKNALRQFSFSYVYSEWLKQRKKDLSQDKIAPSYYEKLKQYAKKYNEFEWPEDVRQIKTYHIRKFERSLPSTLSIKSQKNVLMVLQKFFNDLYHDSLIPDMPIFPRIQTEEKEIGWIDRATQVNILLYIPPEDQPIFKFLFSTGLRPAEVRALKWKDIDHEHECIHIRAGFSKGIYREITKTKRQWAIPILKSISDTLENLPRNLGTEHLFWYKDSKGRFFRSYGEKKLRDLWNTACKAAGVEKVTLYSGTRHSFASQYVNEGIALTDIGAMMGHTSTQTTKKYAHLDKLKRLREVFK